MNLVRTCILPVYLAAYSTFLLLAFGWLPLLSGGRPDGDLLYGHLAMPERAAEIGVLAPLLLAVALFLGGPKQALARALMISLIAAMLVILGPALSGHSLPLSNVGRSALLGLLLAPLMWLRGGEQPTEPRVPLALAVGSLASGAGVTIALFALERRLQLFGYGDPAEAHLGALVLCCLAAVGAFLIGLPMAKAGRTLAALAAIFTAAGALVGLSQLAPLATGNGLDQLLGSIGSDLSELGRLRGSGWVAARTFVIAGFSFGALIVGLDSRRAQGSFILGVALARFYWPDVISGEAAKGMPHIVDLGLWLATLGAIPAVIWHWTKGKGAPRLLAPVAFLAIVTGTFWLPRSDAKPLSPWLKFKTEALFEADTPLGWLTVETTRSGTPVLTIDRVAVTPSADQAIEDAMRISASLDLMAAAWRPDDPNPDVLFAGQLTQPRLDAFNTWRDRSGLDVSFAWSTPWDNLQSRIRPLLETASPLPDPLPFETAQTRIGSGEYDLVIVPMAFGPELVSMSANEPPRSAAPTRLPVFRDTELGQPAVVWIPTSAPIAGTPLGNRILLAGSDLNHLGVGLVQLQDADQRYNELLVNAGKPVAPRCVLQRLDLRPEQRTRSDRAAFFVRLASASSTPFLAVISRMLQAQEQSSPWAPAPTRFEVDGDLLNELAQVTPNQPTDFERLAWNHLAAALAAKRMPAESLAVLPGLLEGAGRWPEIEYALARADLELLLNRDAVKLLQRLFDENRLTVLQLIELGNCQNQLGNWEAAAAAFERAISLQPENVSIERWAAIASLRAGLPGALERIQALLDADPENPELAEYLLPGPLPPVPSGFNPNPL